MIVIVVSLGGTVVVAVVSLGGTVREKRMVPKYQLGGISVVFF